MVQLNGKAYLVLGFGLRRYRLNGSAHGMKKVDKKIQIEEKIEKNGDSSYTCFHLKERANLF